MRKVALLLAVLLAAAFTMNADAARKRAAAKPPADPVHEWNKKNMPAMKAPGTAAAPAKAMKKKAAKKGKKAKKAKKGGKKAMKKKA